jgi:flagellar basal-body rod modification protein FlgD
VSITTPDALGLGQSLAATNKTGAANSGSKNNLDKNTFMTLLVAQLKNQDPLAPQDGAQFLAQLAQFNSVEQLININDKLNQFLNQQTATGAKA